MAAIEVCGKTWLLVISMYSWGSILATEGAAETTHAVELASNDCKLTPEDLAHQDSSLQLCKPMHMPVPFWLERWSARKFFAFSLRSWAAIFLSENSCN
jgi:hypothetical protein